MGKRKNGANQSAQSYERQLRFGSMVRKLLLPSGSRRWITPIVMLLLLLGIIAGAFIVSSVTQRHVQLDDGTVWITSLKDRKAARFNAKNKDVVVCASDLMAIGAMNALIDMDIFRPVCGFDGITLMGYVGKQMNTIRQDFYSISSRAVEEVHQLMNGGEGHQVIMPHSIVKMYYKDIIC